MESPGLVAHYDFQYQGGGIVHRFRDIPALYAQAREMGLSHLLLSGWNVDGFDNGFPMYTPSPELGTEEELRQALRQVREAGRATWPFISIPGCAPEVCAAGGTPPDRRGNGSGWPAGWWKTTARKT